MDDKVSRREKELEECTHAAPIPSAVPAWLNERELRLIILGKTEGVTGTQFRPPFNQP